MSFDFSGKVAIVTGAGGGLGRSHALSFAARGASVVVNDLGGARDGSGESGTAAEKVVAEIVAAGGKAIANGGNVAGEADMIAMAEAAKAAFGRVDILVNNAGILRDKTFAKMAADDFKLVLDVHLGGAINAIKAVLPMMQEQNYGRIIMTTSCSGLYGSFGQSNYGAAKMGLVGLMNTLKLEFSKYSIKVNALAPVAATRMTDDVMPPQMLDLLTPESVTPAVLFLAGDDAPNGEIITAGAGSFARAHIVESDGLYLGPDATPEMIAESWKEICDVTTDRHYHQGSDQGQKFVANAFAARG